MKLSDLGERAIIGKLGRFLDIGDDAACIGMGDGFLIMSTDTIHGPTHIPPEMTPQQIGKFIVTVNLSDLAAMGAKPLAFLLSYGGPDIEFTRFENIIKSAQKQCRKFGIDLVGGDTKEMRELTLTGCAVGTAKRPVLRSGARPGDIVAVTGELGAAGKCFELLGRGIKPHKSLLKAALEPEPRIKEGILLAKHANSMTDISDSLAISIYSIAEQSGVGMKIDINKIPASSIDHALYSGGDYQLLFTMPEKDFTRVKNSVNATKIGEITKSREISATRKGRKFRIKRKGYEHFSRNR